jgi:hypothetical protein
VSEILKLTIVEDISLICDIKPGESPYYIQTLYPNDIPDMNLDRYAQELLEPVAVPTTSFGYTDIDGPPRLVEIQDDAILRSAFHAIYIESTRIVMAHIYEEC